MNGEKNVAISADLLNEVAELAQAEGKTPGELIEEATRELLTLRRNTAEQTPHAVDENEKESRRKFADFSAFVGKWEPDPEFDEILAAQRQIDPELWK